MHTFSELDTGLALYCHQLSLMATRDKALKSHRPTKNYFRGPKRTNKLICHIPSYCVMQKNIIKFELWKKCVRVMWHINFNEIPKKASGSKSATEWKEEGNLFTNNHLESSLYGPHLSRPVWESLAATSPLFTPTQSILRLSLSGGLCAGLHACWWPEVHRGRSLHEGNLIHEVDSKAAKGKCRSRRPASA